MVSCLFPLLSSPRLGKRPPLVRLQDEKTKCPSARPGNRFSCLEPGLDWTRLFMSLTAGAGTRCTNLLPDSPTLWLERKKSRDASNVPATDSQPNFFLEFGWSDTWCPRVGAPTFGWWSMSFPWFSGERSLGCDSWCAPRKGYRRTVTSLTFTFRKPRQEKSLTTYQQLQPTDESQGMDSWVVKVVGRSMTLNVLILEMSWSLFGFLGLTVRKKS